MKSWKEDNFLIKMHEAETFEDKNYLEELKQLINGELVAHMQYQMAADSIVGDNLSYLQSHFSEHAGEELGHYSQLVSALMQRDGEAEKSLIASIQNAMPETEELASFDSEYLKDFFLKAEQSAIQAYQSFYDKIESSDKDLADIIIKIEQDEKNHALDFSRMSGETIEEEPVEEEVSEESSVEEEPVEDAEESVEKALSL